jgi:hypothetical protein
MTRASCRHHHHLTTMKYDFEALREAMDTETPIAL